MSAYGPSQKPFVDFLWLVVLSICAAAAMDIIFVHASASISHGLKAWHQTHLMNQAPAPLQYRLLSFLLPEMLIRNGVDPFTAYRLLKLTYLAASFYVCAQITMKITDEPLAPTLIILAIALYFGSSIQAHFQFAEEPNLLFFSLLILCILNQKHILILAILIGVGALYKDTIGFVLPFFIIHSIVILKSKRKAVIEGGFLSLVYAAIYIGIRFYLGTDRGYLGGVWQLTENIRFTYHYPLYSIAWMLPSVLPAIYIARHWKVAPLVVRCFMPSLILMVIGHLLISRIEEFRTYAPLATITWPALLAIRSANAKTLAMNTP